jgi:hypothetical protein
MATPIRLLARRRPPTYAERVLGRKRARKLRRRLALVAFGAGVSLAGPTLKRSAAIAIPAFALVAIVLVR